MNGLDFLLDPPAKRFSEWAWATVTQVKPLRIRLDGDIEPLGGSPTLMFSGSSLSVGTRVRVHIDKSRALGQVGAHIYVFGGAGDIAELTGDRDIPGTSGGQGGWAMRIGPILICAAWLTITPTANSNSNVKWTYPAAFGAPPAITVTAETIATTVLSTRASSITTTSALVGVVRTNTTNTPIYAVAIGPAV